MNVSLVLIIVMAVLFACGVYAMLERSLTRVLIGFLLLGNAANLMLLVVMGGPGVAPFFGTGSPDEMSDPLPQALTLTAIVITFAVSAFLLALIYRSWQLGQADTVEDDDADSALREGSADAEEAMDDETEIDDPDDDATTDFVGSTPRRSPCSAAATSVAARRRPRRRAGRPKAKATSIRDTSPPPSSRSW